MNAAEFLKIVPKNTTDNIIFRKKVLALSKEEQMSIRDLCFEHSAEGFELFLTLFGWIYSQRDSDKEDGYKTVQHFPFIPYEYQIRVSKKIIGNIINQKPLLVDKSRGVGLSYLTMAIAVWCILAFDSVSILVGSRKEDYVDDGASPKSLFYKARYILEKLPAWMSSRIDSKDMHIKNLDNNSVIEGESTNENFARGDRRWWILLDEFSAVENQESVLAATSDAADCRIFVSTPSGMNNEFARMRFSGKVDVLTVHWHEHPLKGKDAKLVNGKWTSSWYQAECDKRTSKLEIAQELDIDYIESGSAFFSSDVLSQVRLSGEIKEPTHIGRLNYEVITETPLKSYDIEDIEFIEKSGERNDIRDNLKFYEELIDGRPNQNENYVVFCDISEGSGASNSVAVILKHTADGAEQVGTLATASHRPYEFAELVVALCRWLGGQKHAFLGWESAGPSGPFAEVIDRIGYPYYYYRENNVGDKTRMPGWATNKQAKYDLLSAFEVALKKQELILHEEMIINEAATYSYDATGRIEPSSLKDDSGAKSSHGDRVIAAAGCLLMTYEQPHFKQPEKPIVYGSYGWRIKQMEKPKQKLWK